MKTYLDIGLEVHVQLKTQTKLFSRAKIVGTNSKPNSSVAPMDLGLPGQMPILNKKAVELGCKIAMGLNSDISPVSYFDRKHYSYLDLPAGFQITQFYKSLAYDGYITLPCGKQIGISSMHLETDAAKLSHEGTTLIDYNRCGTPLLEIVFKPDIHNTEDLGEAVKALQRMIIALGASNCDMSKGQMRVDVNMSLRENDQSPLGKRVEIKNLNSIKSMKEAVAYEIEYQQKNGYPETEYTKGFDNGKTYVMRNKESAADYRYLPEPNIPAIHITPENLKDIKQTMPKKLPYELFKEYLSYTNPERAAVLRDNTILGDIVNKIEHKTIAINLLTNDILSYSKKEEIDLNTINVDNVINLVNMLHSGEIANNMVKKHLLPLFFQSDSIVDFINQKDLKCITDPEVIKDYINQVKEANSKLFDQYKAGNEKILQVIMGKIIGMSKGKINPSILSKIISSLLNN